MAGWNLISADEARRLLLQLPPVSDVERVGLAGAAGRVLAEALVAAHPLPPERRSAMDGYAVRADDLGAAPTELRVVGAVAAGATFAGALGPGETVSIATGATVPDGADAVVMVEATEPVTEAASAGKESRRYVAPGGRVRVTSAVARGANVVEPGEDVKEGAVMLRAGRRLKARDLSALATFGMVDVPVFRRPRIAVLATGNEICPVGEVPGPGQVRDSNQYVLGAEVEAAGGLAIHGGIVGDDHDTLLATVARLCAAHDGVILSGGSSVGPKDLTGRILGALGAPGVIFHGVDIRPGKPTVFARMGDKPVIGMPGYPTSSMVVFEALMRPMLARLCGETVDDPWPTATRARLAEPYAKPASREDYLRVRLEARDGDVWAMVVPGGSAAISNVLQADGLARIPAGVERLEAGAPVSVRQFL
ncbi:MAG TPA: gephyrin-like molybdotransferase Glp [Polyangia bacterium]|jgi:molybdopterin molybdotransferase